MLFIFLFVYAAISKLLSYPKFRLQLGQSPMLTSIAGYVAWIIPTAELGIALVLTFTNDRQKGLLASFSLMTMFTGYIIAITRFSQYIPCSCGGILQNMSWNTHLLFNVIFLLLALTGILLDPTVNRKYQSVKKTWDKSFIAIKQEQPKTWKRVGNYLSYLNYMYEKGKNLYDRFISAGVRSCIHHRIRFKSSNNRHPESPVK